MSEQNEQKYEIKDGFFILSDGTKVPAISLRNIWSKIHKSYVELNYLYSTRVNNFLKGTVIYDDDDETNNGYNIGIRYRLMKDDYVWFTVKIYGNDNGVTIGACDAYLRIDDPEALMRDEYSSYVEKRECISSIVYGEQIDRIVTDNLVIKKLLEIAKSYIQNEKEDLEIPQLDNKVSYEWKDFKQAILYLRQPFDIFA